MPKEKGLEFKQEASEAYKETGETLDNLEFEKQKEELLSYKEQVEKEMEEIRLDCLEYAKENCGPEIVEYFESAGQEKAGK
jgi:hypothetical protein